MLTALRTVEGGLVNVDAFQVAVLLGETEDGHAKSTQNWTPVIKTTKKNQSMSLINSYFLDNAFSIQSNK